MATKPKLQAAQLDKLIANNFFSLQVVKDDIRDDPRGDPKPPKSYWHEPLQGINWAAKGGSNISAYIDEISEIVKALQLQFDMEE